MTSHLYTAEQMEIVTAIKSGMFRHQYLVYNRKSTDEPNNQKNSLKFQKSENTRFVFRERLPLAKLSLPGFCLDGMISEKHSGFKDKAEMVFSDGGMVQYKVERPKFFQLVQFLNAGYFKGVVVLCWDRISRNKGDNNIIEKLLKKGVDFRFVLASYDNTSAGALHMDIDGMFSQHHSRVTAEKVRMNIQEHRKLGVCTYKAPVGYQNPGAREHKPFDKERAPIVRQMFELYDTGEWSFSDLARWSIEQGFSMPPSRRRRTEEERLAEEEDDIQVEIAPIIRPPTAGSISKILHNRFYIGEVYGHDGRWVASSSHAPLISKELFDRVQVRMSNRTISSRYVPCLGHPMRGLVRCAQCRRIYTPYPKKGIMYYGCHCAPGCSNLTRTFNLKFLTNAIGETIKSLTFTPDEMQKINADDGNSTVSLEQQLENEKAELDRKRNKIKADIDYIRENKLTLLKAGVYTPESLVQEEDKLHEQFARLSYQAPPSAAELLEIKQSMIKLSELVKTLYLYYEKAFTEEKEAITKILFSELYISESSLICKGRNGIEILKTRSFAVCDHIAKSSEAGLISHRLKNSISEVEKVVNPSALSEE